MAITDQLTGTLGLLTTMARASVIAPLRPDKYLRIAAAMARENMGITSGFASAAQRCPDRPGLVDELGTLTWRDIDQRADAFAAALQDMPGGAPCVIGIMARNHRGFVESLIAANRIGADVLLLNTSFAGPALAEVVSREHVDAVVCDEEFTPTVDRALADSPDTVRIVAWTDTSGAQELTVETMIGEHIGSQPRRAEARSRVILLTSGTTGTPKGTSHSGGSPMTLKGILDRTPWHAEEVTVVVAPMFHAWASRSWCSRRRWRVRSSPGGSSIRKPRSRSSTGTKPPDCASSQSCSTGS